MDAAFSEYSSDARLLTPGIDHLFDRGFISFRGDQFAYYFPPNPDELTFPPGTAGIPIGRVDARAVGRYLRHNQRSHNGTQREIPAKAVRRQSNSNRGGSGNLSAWRLSEMPGCAQSTNTGAPKCIFPTGKLFRCQAVAPESFFRRKQVAVYRHDHFGFTTRSPAYATRRR
jgi:hypothetical protein